jgi:hypothetical protein
MFIGSLPSNGHDADYIKKHIRYFCEVFSERCVATSTAGITENTAPLLFTACLLDRFYRAVA